MVKMDGLDQNLRAPPASPLENNLPPWPPLGRYEGPLSVLSELASPFKKSSEGGGRKGARWETLYLAKLLHFMSHSNFMWEVFEML